ncbi:hypothetical protein KFL_001210245 [Klebsormidium nitens]|uniref:Uncharacterized protein n=1 Tax=Klebsormidium nitens TaxID=105231 RepID=A0A1Y1I0Q8_KLENI|nr:hypothetical protein KFL_001210245 [Klebsormidium nitens]|eukprot:GAQ82731.1 hypothetical protein KFL_001210245 [Klebsormidium nitens]
MKESVAVLKAQVDSLRLQRAEFRAVAQARRQVDAPFANTGAGLAGEGAVKAASAGTAADVAALQERFAQPTRELLKLRSTPVPIPVPVPPTERSSLSPAVVIEKGPERNGPVLVPSELLQREIADARAELAALRSGSKGFPALGTEQKGPESGIGLVIERAEVSKEGRSSVRWADGDSTGGVEPSGSVSREAVATESHSGQARGIPLGPLLTWTDLATCLEQSENEPGRRRLVSMDAATVGSGRSGATVQAAQRMHSVDKLPIRSANGKACSSSQPFGYGRKWGQSSGTAPLRAAKPAVKVPLQTAAKAPLVDRKEKQNKVRQHLQKKKRDGFSPSRNSNRRRTAVRWAPSAARRVRYSPGYDVSAPEEPQPDVRNPRKKPLAQDVGWEMLPSGRARARRRQSAGRQRGRPRGPGARQGGGRGVLTSAAAGRVRGQGRGASGRPADDGRARGDATSQKLAEQVEAHGREVERLDGLLEESRRKVEEFENESREVKEERERERDDAHFVKSTLAARDAEVELLKGEVESIQKEVEKLSEERTVRTHEERLRTEEASALRVELSARKAEVARLAEILENARAQAEGLGLGATQNEEIGFGDAGRNVGGFGGLGTDGLALLRKLANENEDLRRQLSHGEATILNRVQTRGG